MVGRNGVGREEGVDQDPPEVHVHQVNHAVKLLYERGVQIVESYAHHALDDPVHRESDGNLGVRAVGKRALLAADLLGDAFELKEQPRTLGGITWERLVRTGAQGLDMRVHASVAATQGLVQDREVAYDPCEGLGIALVQMAHREGHPIRVVRYVAYEVPAQDAPHMHRVSDKTL